MREWGSGGVGVETPENRDERKPRDDRERGERGGCGRAAVRAQCHPVRVPESLAVLQALQRVQVHGEARRAGRPPSAPARGRPCRRRGRSRRARPHRRPARSLCVLLAPAICAPISNPPQPEKKEMAWTFDSAIFSIIGLHR